MNEFIDIEIPNNLKSSINDARVHIYELTETKCLCHKTIDKYTLLDNRMYIIVDAKKYRQSPVTQKTYYLVSNNKIDKNLFKKAKVIVEKLVKFDQQKTNIKSNFIIVSSSNRPDRFSEILNERSNNSTKTELTRKAKDWLVKTDKNVRQKFKMPKAISLDTEQLMNYNFNDVNKENSLLTTQIKEEPVTDKNDNVASKKITRLSENDANVCKKCLVSDCSTASAKSDNDATLYHLHEAIRPSKSKKALRPIDKVLFKKNSEIKINPEHGANKKQKKEENILTSDKIQNIHNNQVIINHNKEIRIKSNNDGILAHNYEIMINPNNEIIVKPNNQSCAKETKEPTNEVFLSWSYQIILKSNNEVIIKPNTDTLLNSEYQILIKPNNEVTIKPHRSSNKITKTVGLNIEKKIDTIKDIDPSRKIIKIVQNTKKNLTKEHITKNEQIFNNPHKDKKDYVKVSDGKDTKHGDSGDDVEEETDSLYDKNDIKDIADIDYFKDEEENVYIDINDEEDTDKKGNQKLLNALNHRGKHSRNTLDLYSDRDQIITKEKVKKADKEKIENIYFENEINNQKILKEIRVNEAKKNSNPRANIFGNLSNKSMHPKISRSKTVDPEMHPAGHLGSS